MRPLSRIVQRADSHCKGRKPTRKMLEYLNSRRAEDAGANAIVEGRVKEALDPAYALAPRAPHDLRLSLSRLIEFPKRKM